jgi:hypothetical protein
MSKERQTNLNNVVMFALTRAILFMCVRAGHMMGDAELGEERIELLVLPLRLPAQSSIPSSFTPSR